MATHQVIAGIDEVGYGSLAGRVAVAACILDPEKPIEGIKDSKAFTSHTKRASVAQKIRENAAAYSISFRPNTLIDEIGIVGALQEAIRECVANLAVKPDRILIDGTPFKASLNLSEEYIVKGDATVPCISAASILAKVARDEFMMQLAHERPEYACYDFVQNKGYGTLAHRKAIKTNGLCPIHRKCYCTQLL